MLWKLVLVVAEAFSFLFLTKELNEDKYEAREMVSSNPERADWKMRCPLSHLGQKPVLTSVEGIEYIC